VTENSIIVLVEDEGPGVPDDKLNDVFEPFVRIETSRSKQTAGIGMGLAIARSIIRAHGGDIRLDSRSARGLRVTITLPHIANERGAEAHPKATNEA
jgi:signal transduction histidine kinase